ncbi:hypothetical protein ACFWXO_16305 [Kitasatospora sp. NPDC059088]|uniref:hypothetical protein n=1 Tax=Kitasatospora sp. NPDC059088 TaxID=3346722 RepID=UPI0036B8FBD9
MEQPPRLVVRHELWKLLETARDPSEAVSAEAAHHGLTAQQLLDTLVRQNRVDVKPLPARHTFTPHKMSDFD